MGGGRGSYPPGDYLVEDMNGADFITLGRRGTVTMSFIEVNPRPMDEKVDWNGRRILIVRPGGFGDLLFLTPSINEMKRRWPSCYLTVASFAQFRPVLKTAQVDELTAYPVPVAEAMTYDVWIFLENVIEGSEEAEHEHAVDMVAKRCGLSSLASKEMTFELLPDERQWAESRYPRTERTRIGIQLEASSKCRTYPGHRMMEVIMTLDKMGVESYLFGAPGSVPFKSTEKIRNLPLENLSFRQSMAAMSTCDAVLGPDSALIHVAGAMKMPALGLYGPFPWKLRTAYAPTVEAIQGFGGCSLAPCFYHGSRISPHFPMDGPCFHAKRCIPLDNIEPKRVVNKVLQLAKYPRQEVKSSPTESHA